MKKFVIEVPEGTTRCGQCPFWRNYDVCTFLSENKYCDTCNFEATHIWDLEFYNRQALEAENTEFECGHNVNYADHDNN